MRMSLRKEKALFIHLTYQIVYNNKIWEILYQQINSDVMTP